MPESNRCAPKPGQPGCAKRAWSRAVDITPGSHAGDPHDAANRGIVWAMSQLLDTALLSIALRMAITQRHYSQNLIVHSDRGAQFASAAYRQLLSRHGLTASMSRKGNCYDNAFESFFSSLKYE